MNRKRAVQSALARRDLNEGGFLNLRTSIAVGLCAFAGWSVLTATLLGFFIPQAGSKDFERNLSFAERVAYQRAIEKVYWRHSIWPDQKANPKPPLDSVMSRTQFEKKVADYIRKSQVLEDHWQRPITAEQLQAEMDRMAANTKQPDVLLELFEALGNDPFVIAECLARPILAERLFTGLDAHIGSATELKHSLLSSAETKSRVTNTTASRLTYMLPPIGGPRTGCTEDTWTPTSMTNAPSARAGHTAVWTGVEMIVWGGGATGPTYFNTGGRYNPSTDSWATTNATNAPDARAGHTTVWTGGEMIVWGGFNDSGYLNTGARYKPGTDTWTATSTTSAPGERQDCTAVWSGKEMIVWGGYNGEYLNTGARYNPGMDSWTATSTVNAPPIRYEHTAVWSGSEMIVWGGFFRNFALDTGGRYNPDTDSWTPTSTISVPAGRGVTMSVWTGSEMIVWGGWDDLFFLNTGGRYNPGTDTWKATSTTNAPASRFQNTAVWTGSEMIVWGGWDPPNIFNTGGRYNPDTDSWTATSSTNAPGARYVPTGVWTGSEMMVWGGAASGPAYFDTGGRYCAAAPSPTATATATITPPQTPTPTPSEPPCEVTGSQPACNSIVSTPLTDFTVYVSYFINPSVPANAFTVNGIPADDASVASGIIFFHFNASPLVQGENSMHIPRDSFTCINGRGVGEFMCAFTYRPPRSKPAPRVRPTPVGRS